MSVRSRRRSCARSAKDRRRPLRLRAIDGDRLDIAIAQANSDPATGEHGHNDRPHVREISEHDCYDGLADGSYQIEECEALDAPLAQAAELIKRRQVPRWRK